MASNPPVYQIGDMQLMVLNDGIVHVDAGGPFGLIPRMLYKNILMPDATNMIPMRLHSLLVRAAGKIILVDTGLGDKLNDRQRAMWNIEQPGGGLIAELARQGIAPGDVDLVINTHLHADHCAGNTQFNPDFTGVRPTFPNAEYVTQRREYDDAMRPNERTRATYISPNYEPLVVSGQMRLLDGDTEIVPGIFGVVMRGHTPAMMGIRFTAGDQQALFVSDLASYAVHFSRLGWMTSYDVEPLETLESKRHWRQWALETQALLLFQHDPKLIAGRYVAENNLDPVTLVEGV
jgi:glyoxylase-like metal-dependent hydrolase (beta-lactamase superfamily II)